MRRIIEIVSWICATIGLIIILVLVNDEYNKTTCKSINIYVDTKNNNFFVNEEDIVKILNNYDKSLIKRNLEEINTNTIEELVTKHPSIDNIEVYKTIDGKMKIFVKQRNPIVRIINYNNESYYIDEKGALMPLSPNYSSRVIVANGNIMGSYNLKSKTNVINKKNICASDSLLNNIYMLASYINGNKFLKSQIIQIYVREDGDVELVPRVGGEIINIGEISDIDDKFKKLLIFYKKGINNIGWNRYKEINLKYKNQVVCTVKD